MSNDERDTCTLRGMVIDRLGGVGNLTVVDRWMVKNAVEQFQREHGDGDGKYWQETDPVVRVLQEYGFREVGIPSLAGRVGDIADRYERSGRVKTAQRMRRGVLRKHRC